MVISLVIFRALTWHLGVLGCVSVVPPPANSFSFFPVNMFSTWTFFFSTPRMVLVIKTTFFEDHKNPGKKQTRDTFVWNFVLIEIMEPIIRISDRVFLVVEHNKHRCVHPPFILQTDGRGTRKIS